MNLGGLLLFTLGAVLVQLESEDYKRLIANLRAAIQKSGLREKEVAYACGVSDPAQFSQMLNGHKRIPLDVIAAMPAEVKQYLFFDGVLDYGLPREVSGGYRMLKAVLRGGKRDVSVA